MAYSSCGEGCSVALFTHVALLFGAVDYRLGGVICFLIREGEHT